MEKKNTTASSAKDFAELIGAFTKYGTLVIGGLCLLLYSNEIGQFPEGVGLGEGLAFYLVCVGFLIFYSIYACMCTAFGSLVLAWPARLLYRKLLQKSASSKKVLAGTWLHTDFSPMWEPPVIAAGLVGFLAHMAYIYLSSEWSAAIVLLVPFLQGIGVVCLLMVTQRHRHFESGLLFAEDTAAAVAAKRKDVILVRRVFFVWLAVVPMIVMQDRSFLVDAAFRMAQLRKDSATVHIKSPWSTRVARSSLNKMPSFMGSDYQEFRKVKVLLRSVGARVVIEIPEASGPVRLSIPTDSIYVE